MIEIDKYYDLGCYNCGRHWSTDFDHGLCEDPEQLRLEAKLEGWTEAPDLPGMAICPICNRHLKSERIHNEE